MRNTLRRQRRDITATLKRRQRDVKAKLATRQQPKQYQSDIIKTTSRRKVSNIQATFMQPYSDKNQHSGALIAILARHESHMEASTRNTQESYLRETLFQTSGRFWECCEVGHVFLCRMNLELWRNSVWRWIYGGFGVSKTCVIFNC